MSRSLRACIFIASLASCVVAGAAAVRAQSANSTADPDRARAEASSESRAPRPPQPPPRPRQEALQALYRRLYEVQLELAQQQGSASPSDSLLQVRTELLAEIEKLARELERARARRQIPRPPSSRGAEDFSVLMGELENMKSEIDWEELTRALESKAQNFGEGLAMLGEQLRDLQVQIDSDRVRVETGAGGRFTFTIPSEVKSDISQGIREMSRELSRVLDDSTRRAVSSEFRVLLDELPREMFGRDGPRSWRTREKKVIAESVFQAWKDFEVGDDELVRGDVVIVGGDAYVAGEVQGNVYVLFGDLYVEGRGTVAADAISVGGRVSVDDESEVHGRRFDVSSVLPGFGIGVWSGSGGISWLVYSVRFAVLAMLLVFAYALAGGRIGVMVEHGEDRVGRNLLSGALWFSVVLGVFVVAAVGLAISVIGIPVVLVLTAAFVMVVLLAYFTGCQVVGDRLLRLFGGSVPSREWQVALVGLVLLELPALARAVLSSATMPSEMIVLLTAADFFVKFLVLAIGFGAAIATRLGGPVNGIVSVGKDPASAVSGV